MEKARLKDKYEKEVHPMLMKEFAIKNTMAVPKITKIVVNSGIGALRDHKEPRERFAADFGVITGQKAKVQAARISVAGFGIREGQPVGLTSTLHGKRMYDFLDKLISIVLPRVRDFRGISVKGFDKSGNYTLGIPEHTLFPEIDVTKVERPFGLQVTIVTTAKNKEQAFSLLSAMGMPFEKEN